MARIAVMGAGIGGISQAYELRERFGHEHEVHLIGDSEVFEFTPSNPWVAVGWRKPSQVTVPLAPIMKKHGIEFSCAGVKRVHPAENRLDLGEGTSIDYDYLVIATGPDLAFDEVEGLGPVAIPPVAPTPVPTGAPKTGFMIESMVTATTENIASLVAGKKPSQQGTWNAVCLADFGDSGVAFVALPQIPPRNTNWASRGKWVHLAKIAYEKYFLRKVRKARTEPYYEKAVMKMVGALRLKEPAR